MIQVVFSPLLLNIKLVKDKLGLYSDASFKTLYSKIKQVCIIAGVYYFIDVNYVIVGDVCYLPTVCWNHLFTMICKYIYAESEWMISYDNSSNLFKGCK